MLLPECYLRGKSRASGNRTGHPMARLNKRFLDKILADTSASKEITHWDDELKGFGLRAQPGGAMSWVIMYRTTEGRRLRKHTLGSASKMTPDEARKEARRKLALVDQGADPAADKRAAHAAMSVSELCDLYTETVASQIKPSTLAMDKSRIECHVKPLLGRLSVRSLTVEDIERFQMDVAAGKTAKPRKDNGRSGLLTGGRGVAARTVGMLGTILEFARRRKVITENPARSVKKFETGKNKRFLSIDEITALGKVMREAETENKTGMAAISALLMTGCRREEILGMPWDWLDVKARCLRLGDSKTGYQIRPLGRAAIKHLEAQKRADDDRPWVFPADRGDGHFVGLPNVLDRVCGAAKLNGVTVHVLRHSFASVAAELGFSELTIAGLIGHSTRGVTARYAHVPDSALLSAADAVSQRIADALAGKKEGAQVVRFRAAK